MPKISVIVRALDEERHIGRLLIGLQRQSIIPDEIILVDSGSTDATVDIARSLGCRITTISRGQFSFGRALNVGCQAAEGDIFLIVSAHVYPVYEDYVERLISPLLANPLAFSYGRQIGDERTKFSETRVMQQWFPDISTTDQDHPFCNNANAMVTRELWEALHYDESLTGLEDLDFGTRALELGATIHYVAEAPVVHVHEETWGQIRLRYYREALAYRSIVGAAPFGSLTAFRLAASNAAADISHALRHERSPQLIPSILMFRAMQFLGAWQGRRLKGPTTEDLRRRFYYPATPAPPPSGPHDAASIDYSS